MDKKKPPEEDIEINRYSLQEEFADQARRFFYWSKQYERGLESLETMKLNMEILESNLDLSIRKKFEKARYKITEGFVKAKIRQSPLWKRLSKQIIKKRREVNDLKNAMKAFEHRKDMLVQLGAKERKEWDQLGLRVKKKQPVV
jgi:hypothetical protein